MSAWWLFLLIPVVYGYGWYHTALLLARRSNADHERRYRMLPIEEYKGEHLAFAMFIALFWPVVLPVTAMHARMISVVGPTPTEWQAENQRLTDEIARLEREAGLS
jgi:hypothetical protein